MHLNGKKNTGKCHLMARDKQMDGRFMFMKYFGHRGLSAPAPVLYTCI